MKGGRVESLGPHTATTGCALIQGFFSREPVIFNHLQARSQNRAESDQGLRGQAALRAADFFLFLIRCRACAWHPGGGSDPDAFSSRTSLLGTRTFSGVSRNFFLRLRAFQFHRGLT
jgi:hypothetical protein